MVDWFKAQFRQISDTPLDTLLHRSCWMFFSTMLLLAALHQFALYLIIDVLHASRQWWEQVLIYTLTGSVAIWLVITWISDAAARRCEDELDLQSSDLDPLLESKIPSLSGALRQSQQNHG